VLQEHFVTGRPPFIADDERFTTPYLETLTSLHDKGSRAILQWLVG
jgi:hypothetical protein